VAELTAKQAALVAAIENGKTVSAAAALARVNPGTHYRWLRESESYRQAIDAAQQRLWDGFLAAAVDRAIHGVRRLRFCGGKPVIDPSTGKPYVEIKYDDRLLIVLLRLFRPEKYGPMWCVPAAFRRR